jgi:hypothetical protein
MNVWTRAGRYRRLLAVDLVPGYVAQVGSPFLPRTGPAAVAGRSIPVHEGSLVRLCSDSLGNRYGIMVGFTALQP